MAAGPGSTTRRPDRTRVVPRLERLAASAGRLILWERLWRALNLPLCVIAIFLAASFLGLWDRIEPVWRPAGLALFAIAFIASLWPLVRLRGAVRAERLARVDRDGGASHRPATALDDRLALGGADTASAELWALHQKRAAAVLDKVRLAAPSPELPRRDPRALRIAVLLITCVAAFVAGSDWSGRLGAAFAWTAPPAAETIARVDGWIDPPAYTRVPPLMLDLSGAQAQRDIKVPLGSVVVVRGGNPGEVTFATSGDLAEVKDEAPAADADRPRPAAAKESAERRWKLGAKAATLIVRRGSRELARLAIEPIPDRPPTVALGEAPQRNTRGTLGLAYKTDDDYGVVSAEAEFRLAPPPKAGAKPPRPLADAPKAALSLPSSPGGIGDGKTVVDLSTHPFAGARMALVITVKDEAEQEGRSEATSLILPQRPFTKPLAKALVEQRRDLSVDANRSPLVLEAIYALMIAPDRFTPEPSHFLGLKIIANRLKAAREDDEFREVAELMWEMAVRIEDGDLNQVERDLRAAEEALRQALENNASPEEIQRLTQDLRAALDRYMRELADQLRREQRQEQAERRPEDRNQQNLRPRDLQSLMDRMDEANRRGDREEARRLLEELQNMLDGLRTARPQQPMSPQAREMMRSIEELERMIREQQGLRDETFKEGQQRRADRNRQGRRDQTRPGDQGQQQQRQPGQRGRQSPQGDGGDDEQQDGQDGQQGNPRMGRGDRGGQDEQSLAERQKRLREQLEAMKRRMQGQGMQGEQGLDDAEGAMREAEGALGGGQDGDAVDAMGRALEAMRRGAQGLAQQMQPGGPGGNEFGDGDPAEGMDDRGPLGPRGRAAEREDPLGRPNRTRDWQDHRGHVPKAGETPLQRAQRVVEELRRRLSDPSRAQEELEYLRRLLSPY